ncbi:MAG: hypothetical protein II177_05395 [Lachnospiraceae bacterium]|nr:hypothetical protein [Lachnospiraceae bacterium]
MQNITRFQQDAVNAILEAESTPLTVHLQEDWTSKGREKLLTVNQINDTNELQMVPVINVSDIPDSATPRQIAEIITDIYANSKDRYKLDPAKMSSKDYILQHIQARMISANRAADAEQSEVLMIPFLDIFRVYFAVIVDSRPENGEMISYSIRQSHIDDIGISVDELLEAAKRNLKKEVTLEPIEDILNIGDQDNPTFYVASNSHRQFGASVLLIDDFLEAFKTKTGQGYHIIPSSIHEVLLIPDSLGIPETDLREMLLDVNASIVKPNEVLGDKILSYDTKLTVVE